MYAHSGTKGRMPTYLFSFQSVLLLSTSVTSNTSGQVCPRLDLMALHFPAMGPTCLQTLTSEGSNKICVADVALIFIGVDDDRDDDDTYI